MADEENECIAETVGLNLYLGRPRSSSSRSSDLGSDLSLDSLTLPFSSDSSEIGDLLNGVLPFDLNFTDEPCQEPEGLSNVESHAFSQRALWQSLLGGTERTDSGQLAPPFSELSMLEIMSSQQSLGTNVRQKAPAEVVAANGSEKEAEEKNRCANNFDCNICFDTAKEPVVTSCGHLFCWPCLYRWLHVHSDHKKCPVCKGEVTESIITPIYGRGCSRSDNKNKGDENCASGLSIPPRPRGTRLESRRQLFYRISRLVEEGIANSWRHSQDYQTNNVSRFSGHEDVLMDFEEDVLMEEILGGDPAILTSSMSRRIEQGNTEGGPTTVKGRFQRDDESVLRDGDTESIPNEIDSGWGLHCISAIDNLDAMNSEIGRAVGRFTENTNFCGPSSSVNSLNPIVGARPSADQASASSAVAEIVSESSARDALAEPNSAGSSTPYRRIRGSSSSGSDDDGGNCRVRKGRRLH